jgi:hypothetical protein
MSRIEKQSRTDIMTEFEEAQRQLRTQGRTASQAWVEAWGDPRDPNSRAARYAAADDAEITAVPAPEAVTLRDIALAAMTYHAARSDVVRKLAPGTPAYDRAVDLEVAKQLKGNSKIGKLYQLYAHPLAAQATTPTEMLKMCSSLVRPGVADLLAELD